MWEGERERGSPGLVEQMGGRNLGAGEGWGVVSVRRDFGEGAPGAALSAKGFGPGQRAPCAGALGAKNLRALGFYWLGRGSRVSRLVGGRRNLGAPRVWSGGAERPTPGARDAVSVRRAFGGGQRVQRLGRGGSLDAPGSCEVLGLWREGGGGSRCPGAGLGSLSVLGIPCRDLPPVPRPVLTPDPVPPPDGTRLPEAADDLPE